MPEQRDVADMLRRIQTLATQASLVVKAFRPQAVANKTLHQEWPMAPRARWHLSQPGPLLRPGEQGAAHHQRRLIAIKAKNEKDTEDGTTITAQCTATTFVLLDKAAQAANARKPGRSGRAGRQTTHGGSLAR